VELARRAALLRDLGHEIIMRVALNLLERCRAFLAAVLASALFTPVAAQAPAWTRGATCYEIFVRSFQDSNADGIGDLRGLISRLDYINDGNPRTHTDLGARCI